MLLKLDQSQTDWFNFIWPRVNKLLARGSRICLILLKRGASVRLWDQRSLKAADSQLSPLGGTRAACTDRLHNLLHVITSENLKHKKPEGTHTSSKWLHNNNKRQKQNATRRSSARLFSSALWVGILGDLWIELFKLCSKKKKKKKSTSKPR